MDAIHTGSLKQGDKLPSLRSLMRLHDISLSTALQLCRAMESDGWVEARDRSGYFVRRPQRMAIAPMEEPVADMPPDPAQFVSMRTRMATFMARGRHAGVKLNFAIARAAPELYPAEALRNAMTRALRQRPELLTTASSQKGHEQFREAVAQRNLRIGMTVSPDEVLVTNGCIEALNLALRAVAKPGDTVAVESPTFYGLLQVLESLGMRALEIPTSPQTGISIEALDLAIHTYDDIKAVVVVPHLQNPIGSVMPDAHKQRLAHLCESHGIALVEDDTYSDLVETEVPLRAVKSWDRTGNVIDPSSFLRDGKSFGGSASLGYSGDDNGRRAGVTLAGKPSETLQWLLSANLGRSHELENRGSYNAPNADRTTPNPQRDRSGALLAKVILTPNADQRHGFTFEHIEKTSRYDLLSGLAKPPYASTSVVGLNARTDLQRDRFTYDGRLRLD